MARGPAGKSATSGRKKKRLEHLGAPTVDVELASRFARSLLPPDQLSPSLDCLPVVANRL